VAFGGMLGQKTGDSMVKYNSFSVKNFITEYLGSKNIDPKMTVL